MNIVRKASLYCEWADEARQTLPSIFMELVNVPEPKIKQIKEIFERAITTLHELPFFKVGPVHLTPFPKTICSQGKPFELSFLDVCIEEAPEMFGEEGLERMRQYIAAELSKHMGAKPA